MRANNRPTFGARAIEGYTTTSKGAGVEPTSIKYSPEPRPVGREPTWDSPQARELAPRACLDCHSNETQYRWYPFVAPVSWYPQSDIDDGRRRLNFPGWALPQREARGAANEVQRQQMP